MSTVNRILCVGDSLTAGLTSPQTAFTPYADTLSQQLGVPADQIGKSGAKVGELVSQMSNPAVQDVFGKSSPGLHCQLQSEKYSTAIIMAGTNDLPDAHTSAQQIVADLIQLHTQCIRSRIRTVAVSVPESRFTGTTPQMEQKRRQVNSAMQQWAATQPEVLYLDMASLIGYSDHNGQWHQDGLHMTSYGYTRFGSVMAGQLQGWHKSRVSQTAGRSRSASPFRSASATVGQFQPAQFATGGMLAVPAPQFGGVMLAAF